MAFDAKDWFCLSFEQLTLQEEKAESHEKLRLYNTEKDKDTSERTKHIPKSDTKRGILGTEEIM